MADRPEFYPDWANNDTTLSVAGGANKIRPALSIRNTGLDENSPITAEELNWQNNNMSQWVKYFDAGDAYDIRYSTSSGTTNNLTLVITPKSSLSTFPTGTITKTSALGWAAGNASPGRLGAPGSNNLLCVWALDVGGVLDCAISDNAVVDTSPIWATTGATRVVKIGTIQWDGASFSDNARFINGVMAGQDIGDETAITSSFAATATSHTGITTTLPVLQSGDGTGWDADWSGRVNITTDASYTGSLSFQLQDDSVNVYKSPTNTMSASWTMGYPFRFVTHAGMSALTMSTIRSTAVGTANVTVVATDYRILNYKEAVVSKLSL